MHFNLSALVFAVGLLTPLTAFADDAGFFAASDISGGVARGSSSTTDGGAPVAGGGVVENVEFGETAGIGVQVGYRFRSPLSAYISYRYTRGDVSWDANFPLFAVVSAFDGTAISHEVMANIAYDFAISDATSLRTSAGLGLSFNELSDMVEKDVATGIFLSDLADHTETSPAARIGAGIQHRFGENIVLGLNVSVAYSGGFETGDTRSGNLGVTSITPYKIDDVWRADLGASMRFRF
jgi:hypothetical protein